MFFEAIYASSTHHVSPRIHHVFTIQKPHRNTLFLRDPLQKAQQNNTKKPQPARQIFFANYGFFQIAFTAIALGELPAGSIVKRVGIAVPAVRMTATSPE